MAESRQREGWTCPRGFEARTTCLLLIDVQNNTWNDALERTHPNFYAHVRDRVLPNLKHLVDATRSAHAEVMYTVIENMTRNGRDRSLDHKLSGFSVAKGSWHAAVIKRVAPGDDEIVLPKTSSGVFNSTNIDYLLRNIGITSLIVTGFLTDQCVDHAIRDAADRGYYVTCVSDACATYTRERHDTALHAFGGYCRILSTAEVVRELVGQA